MSDQTEDARGDEGEKKKGVVRRGDVTMREESVSKCETRR